MEPIIDINALTESMELLLASDQEIPASDLRLFQAQMIAGLAVLNARTRGNKIIYTAGPPSNALGQPGDLGINKLAGDFYEFKAGRWEFLFNVLPRAVAKQSGAAFREQLGNGRTSWLLSPDLVAMPERLRLVRLAVPIAVPAPAPVVGPPGIDAPGPAFAPTTYAAKPTAPQIVKMTRRAGPGESVLLSVAGAADFTEAFLYSGGNLYHATGYARDNAAVFQLPADMADPAALFWIKNASGESTSVLLNCAQLDWAERHITPGLVCYLYGKELTGAKVYMQLQAGGPVVECEVVENNGFKLGYRVPDLEPGAVWLWAHAGRGGALGWSERRAADLQTNATHHRTRAWAGPVATGVLDAAATDNGARVRSVLRTIYDEGRGYGTGRLNAGSFGIERSIFCPGGAGRLIGAKNDAGEPATVLYPAAGFESEGFGLFGSPFAQTDFIVENIHFTNPNGINVGGDNVLVQFKQFKRVSFRNCWITNPNGETFKFGANPDDAAKGEQVYISDMRQTGSGCSMLESVWLYVHGGSYAARNDADSMYNNTGAQCYDFSGLTVGDFNPASTELSEVGIGRVLKAGLNSGSMECGYMGDVTGLGIGPLPNIPSAPQGDPSGQDKNTGEIHMIEGAWVTAQGFPTAQGTRTLTFEETFTNPGQQPYQLKTPGSAIPGRHLVQIQSGPGRGLCFGLAALSADGHTLTLDADIPVQLDSTSRVAVGLFHRTVTMVYCRFTGRAGVATGDQFSAQTGGQVYGGGVDWTIENNDFEALYNGVVISGTQESDNSVAASMFITVRGNKVNKCRRALLLYAVPNERSNWSFSTTAIFAVNYTKNVVTDSMLGDLGLESPRDAREWALCPVPPVDYLVSSTPWAGTIQNFYRAAEVGQSPKPLYPGTISNMVVQPAAGPGLVPQPVTGVPLPLPVGFAFSGPVLSYVAGWPHIIAFLNQGDELVPLARTVEASAGTAAGPVVDAYTRTESDNRFADRAALLQLVQDVAQQALDIGTMADLLDGDSGSLVEAVNELAAQKSNTAAVLTAGGDFTPYFGAQQAADAAVAGSTVMLRGYLQAVDFRKSLTVDATGANFGSNQVGFLPYPSQAVPLIARLRGGTGNYRMAVIRQNATCTLIVEDYTFGPAAWFELFGLFTDSTHVTTVILRRCRGTRSFGINNPNQNGNIAFQCRSEVGQRMTVILEDCPITSEIGEIFSGFVHPDCRIILRGTTTLTPRAGSPLSTLTTLNGAGAVVPADMATILVDERPKSTIIMRVGSKNVQAELVAAGTGYDWIYTEVA
jgi:hypothetical protein